MIIILYIDIIFLFVQLQGERLRTTVLLFIVLLCLVVVDYFHCSDDFPYVFLSSSWVLLIVVECDAVREIGGTFHGSGQCLAM